jgi:hypothetical protein
MCTAQLSFAEERCGATGSDVTGSDVSHVTGSDVTGLQKYMKKCTGKKVRGEK